MQKVGHAIGIMSGKGGVGKSTMSVLLARALSEMNLKVGLLDADLYGPSSHKLLPPDHPPEERGGLLYPASSSGIKCISIGVLSGGEVPAMVRAPIANQWIVQFIEEIEWGELDYLIIDFPPGTGDVQLTLMQHAPLTGTLAVTSPSVLSLLDVGKAIHMSRSMEIPVLGIIENFSCFIDAGGSKSLPFGKEGGRKLASEYNLPLLGEVPLDPLVNECGDRGENLFKRAPKSEVALLLSQLAHALHCMVLGHAKSQTGRLEEFTLEWDDELC